MKPHLPLLERSPCPLLNSLANHGFINHDGKNIDHDQIYHALTTYLNIDHNLTEFLYQAALTTVPNPNATTFTLDNLRTHDILEHDGSLR